MLLCRFSHAPLALSGRSVPWPLWPWWSAGHHQSRLFCWAMVGAGRSRKSCLALAAWQLETINTNGRLVIFGIKVMPAGQILSASVPAGMWAIRPVMVEKYVCKEAMERRDGWK